MKDKKKKKKKSKRVSNFVNNVQGGYYYIYIYVYVYSHICIRTCTCVCIYYLFKRYTVAPIPVLYSPAIIDPSKKKEMSLGVRLLSATAKAPTRGSPLSAGYDVYASEACVIPANGRALVSTGVAVVCPQDTYARVAPRSGLAVKHGIATGAGVVDADYRGEVKVLLFNHSQQDFTVSCGDRIAQLVLEKIATPQVHVLDDAEWIQLSQTERGAGGFGSTGTN